MASSTVENYLKQLYLEQPASDGEMVPMGRLAVAMGVVPGTATSMVKALADSGLVQYEPRGGVRLTASGSQLALHVLRRHRLVELFLVKVLGLDWSVVHDEADALEHAISDRVLERMDVLLGHPTADPHGDPIPTAEGHVHEPHRMSLADCALGVPQRIARVLDQEPEFLQFVERQGLVPGAIVTVGKRESAAEAVKILVRNGEEVSLGLVAAAKILVEPPQGAASAAAP
ncbi:MAG TPA: metal-dependent transcriptional regulator [Thermoanaerobaculia bacterium]|nr:metal-dependent transcriptional regulator [Thermoanaerobaculia bacterium]